MEMSQKPRVRRLEFTILTTIMALLVIYSHATARAYTEYNKESFQYLFIFVTKKLCGFTVPGFLFLSGAKHFLNYKKGNFNYLTFMKKKLIGTLPPYIFWVLVHYFYFISRNYFDFNIFALLKYTALGTLVAPMYFVVVIMQFYILMPLWRVSMGQIQALEGRRKAAGIFVFLLAAAVLMQISKTRWTGFEYYNRIFTSYMLYWVLGIICGANYDSFILMLKRRRPLLRTVQVLIIVAHVALSYLQSRKMFVYTYAEEVNVLFAVSLLLLTLDFCIIIGEKRKKVWPVVSAIAASSYYIYLSHSLMIFIVDQYTPGWGITANLALRILAVYTVPIGVCVLYSTIKKKILGGTRIA